MRLFARMPKPVRAAVVTATAVAAAVTATTVATAGDEPDTPETAASCFWSDAWLAENATYNFAYLDTSATYWSAQYTLPEGARLTLEGRFAHARYQSLNSYDAATAAPVDALNDVQTPPADGSRNPYRTGTSRAVPDHRRAYSLDVSPLPAPADPADRAEGTLYAGKPGATGAGASRQLLFYRVYLPDHGRDLTGGTGLPQPVVTLADGTRLTGDAVCSAVGSVAGPPPLRTLPADTYRAAREQPGKPAGFPATREVTWRAPYTTAWGVGCDFYGKCLPNPARTVGQYSNLDNAYVYAYASRDPARIAPGPRGPPRNAGRWHAGAGGPARRPVRGPAAQPGLRPAAGR